MDECKPLNPGSGVTSGIEGKKSILFVEVTRVMKDATIAGQGLTLAHFPAQPEPFLTQNTPYTPPNTP